MNMETIHEYLEDINAIFICCWWPSKTLNPGSGLEETIQMENSLMN